MLARNSRRLEVQQASDTTLAYFRARRYTLSPTVIDER